MSQATAIASSWARIQVLGGERSRELGFAHGVPSRVVVGSDLSAGLCLRGPGIAPRQVDVLWDGAHLWLEDALRLGRTFVNGQLLNGWVPVVSQAMVSFGTARLWVTAGGASAPAHAPDFGAVARASLLEPGDEDRKSDTGRITIPAEMLRVLRDS